MSKPPTNVLSTRAVLKHNYLFRELSDQSLDRLAVVAVRRTFEKGEIVFSQGDDGDALYGVAAGRVRIGASGGGGQEIFLNIMEPGDVFGEIAVMDRLPRTASATALDASTLVLVKRADFLRLLESEPPFALHLLKLLCERLRWTSDLVEENVFLAGPARLARRLLILASLHGTSTAPGGSLEIRISQAELAQFLGISRQIVNQHLNEWRRCDWIDVGRSQITICNPEALRRFIAGQTVE